MGIAIIVTIIKYPSFTQKDKKTKKYLFFSNTIGLLLIPFVLFLSGIFFGLYRPPSITFYTAPSLFSFLLSIMILGPIIFIILYLIITRALINDKIDFKLLKVKKTGLILLIVVCFSFFSYQSSTIVNANEHHISYVTISPDYSKIAYLLYDYNSHQREIIVKDLQLNNFTRYSLCDSNDVCIESIDSLDFYNNTILLLNLHTHFPDYIYSINLQTGSISKWWEDEQPIKRNNFINNSLYVSYKRLNISYTDGSRGNYIVISNPMYYQVIVLDLNSVNIGNQSYYYFDYSPSLDFSKFVIVTNNNISFFNIDNKSLVLLKSFDSFFLTSSNDIFNLIHWNGGIIYFSMRNKTNTFLYSFNYENLSLKLLANYNKSLNIIKVDSSRSFIISTSEILSFQGDNLNNLNIIDSYHHIWNLNNSEIMADTYDMLVLIRYNYEDNSVKIRNLDIELTKNETKLLNQIPIGFFIVAIFITLAIMGFYGEYSQNIKQFE